MTDLLDRVRRSEALSMDRRSVLAGAATAIAATTFSCAKPSSHTPGQLQLVVGAGRARLLPKSQGTTPVWAYNGRVPGQEIRVRQSQRLRVAVDNRLPEETTVHWHGIRLPNAMDGVPHLTQKPIKPGEKFLYDFIVPDAGTYWYHPHHNSSRQVGRGLYGPLIVEERAPIKVDRDITWMLGDWRLLEGGQISDDFGSMHDSMHAGRIGNNATINGLASAPFFVRTGERVRLRLINAANARVFGLEFHGHEPPLSRKNARLTGAGTHGYRKRQPHGMRALLSVLAIPLNVEPRVLQC